MQPIIGISSYPPDGARQSYKLPRAYIEAIRAAGGVPVILPTGGGEPARLLGFLDGLVLSGGGDIAPERYGGNGHESVADVSSERDAFEIALAEAALARRDRPVLGICRGLQVLNVMLGGDLHPHLPDLGNGTVDHRLPERRPTRHSATVEPGSRLWQALEVTSLDVYSWHHQAVRRVGQGLRPVAWAEDGVIEGLEHEAHPFCIAVQWHPELQLDDPVQQRLFRAFVHWGRS